jgi:signal transduction histidine kinase
MVVLRDITERKRGESELRAQKELFAGLAAVAQAAAARPALRETLRGVLDTSAALVGANQGSIFLLAEDQAIFENIHSSAIHQVGRENIMRALTEGLAGWAVRQREVALVDDAAHDPRWLSLGSPAGSAMAIPILERSHVLGVITLSHTDRRHFQPDHARLMRAVAVQIALAVRNAQMYETQRDLAERAEASSRAKSAFLATMSHELRTPLNAVIGYSQLLTLELDACEEPRFRFELAQIITSSKHLLNLVNDVLDLSQIEAGQARLYVEPVDLYTLVANVIASTRPLAAQNHNTLSLECAEGLGMLSTDLAKLRQILLHLLANACKFTERGSVTLRVMRDGGTHEAAGIRFEIADTGIGMTAEQIGQIFAEFTQANMLNTRRHGGMGLGLALCQQLCRLMGGTITVESAPGRGSTFILSLPTAPVIERA